MPRKKKTKELERKTVQCPIRGHNHELDIVPHPERPDYVVAYCGSRLVYQSRNPAFAVPVSETISGAYKPYVIPDYSDKGD